MMQKEELEKKSLVELKKMCRDNGIIISTTKSKIIKDILDYFTPDVITESIPSKLSIPKDMKIVAVKNIETNKHNQIGRLREKNLVRFLYYSMGVYYYLTNKEFNFI
jgi:hypothetical protein